MSILDGLLRAYREKHGTDPTSLIAEGDARGEAYGNIAGAQMVQAAAQNSVYAGAQMVQAAAQNSVYAGARNLVGSAGLNSLAGMSSALGAAAGVYTTSATDWSYAGLPVNVRLSTGDRAPFVAHHTISAGDYVRRRMHDNEGFCREKEQLVFKVLDHLARVIVDRGGVDIEQCAPTGDIRMLLRGEIEVREIDKRLVITMAIEE